MATLMLSNCECERMESNPSPTTIDSDEGTIDGPQWLKAKALAYGFVALIFGLAFLVDITVPDPLPFLDEALFLLATAFSARAAANEAR